MLSKAKQEHRPTDLYSKGDRQECLPYLEACRYFTLRRHVPLRECSRGRQSGGENGYILRNEANKSIRINTNALGSGTKSQQKTERNPLIEGLCNSF